MELEQKQDAIFSGLQNPFTAIKEDLDARIKVAADKICFAYGINGEVDPYYIANVIKSELIK